MTRRFTFEDGSWIELPDKWLGHHAVRRDEVIAQTPEGTAVSQANFAVAMALLDNWSIEGLGGNPEQWDFSKLSLRLIAWITKVTLEDYWECWTVKKNYSPPSPNG